MEFLLIVLTLLIIPFFVSVIASIVTRLFYDGFERPGYQTLFFKSIMHAYPKDYRERFGDEMLLVFLDTCKESADKWGAVGVFKTFTREITDVTKNAFLIKSEETRRSLQLLISMAISAVGMLFSSEDPETPASPHWYGGSEISNESLSTIETARVIEILTRNALPNNDEYFARIAADLAKNFTDVEFFSRMTLDTMAKALEPSAAITNMAKALEPSAIVENTYKELTKIFDSLK